MSKNTEDHWSNAAEKEKGQIFLIETWHLPQQQKFAITLSTT